MVTIKLLSKYSGVSVQTARGLREILDVPGAFRSCRLADSGNEVFCSPAYGPIEGAHRV